MRDNLMKWSISRKNTEAHRDNVITHMKLKYGDDGGDKLLPPLFFKDMNDLTDDEVRLLDNFTYLFFKGEECAYNIMR